MLTIVDAQYALKASAIAEIKHTTSCWKDAATMNKHKTFTGTIVKDHHVPHL